MHGGEHAWWGMNAWEACMCSRGVHAWGACIHGRDCACMVGTCMGACVVERYAWQGACVTGSWGMREECKWEVRILVECFLVYLAVSKKELHSF